MEITEGRSKEELAFQASEKKFLSLSWWKRERIFMKDLKASEKMFLPLLKSVQDFQASENGKRSVFVWNLYFGCKPEDLQRHFESCGTVSEVFIKTEESGRPKGCAVVEFLEVEAVQKALLLNETQLCGRQIRVGLQRSIARLNGGGKVAASKFQKPAARYQPYCLAS